MHVGDAGVSVRVTHVTDNEMHDVNSVTQYYISPNTPSYESGPRGLIDKRILVFFFYSEK